MIVKNTDLVRNDGCGGCSACCHLLGIRSIAKAPNTPCEHLIELSVRKSRPDSQAGGCSIYGNRPPECQAFECLWLRGVFGNDVPHYRPDRLGLMFSLQNNPRTPGKQFIVCREVWPGALVESNAMAMLCELRTRCIVLTVQIGGSATMAGPQCLLHEITGGSPE